MASVVTEVEEVEVVAISSFLDGAKIIVDRRQTFQTRKGAIMKAICIDYEILKRGWVHAASGQTFVFSNADLEAIAASYDVDAMPAPLVIAGKLPAIEGIIVRLYVDGGKLMAKMQISEALVSAIRDRRVAGLHAELQPFEASPEQVRPRLWLSHITIELHPSKAGLFGSWRRLASLFYRPEPSPPQTARNSPSAGASSKA